MNQSKPPFSAADRSQSTWYGVPSAGAPSKSEISTPSREIVTTWSWPSSMASRVCSMNAETSEARNVSPSPTPTTRGEFRRAATTWSGSWASTATSVKAPPRRWQTCTHGLGQGDAAVDGRLEQVRDDLGVRLGDQLVAVPLQLGAQHGEVLDDPVVHQRDATVRPEVRMRVGVGRRAVRGPAGVPDAGVRGRQRVVGQCLGRGCRACRHASATRCAPRGRRRHRRSRSRGTPACADRRRRPRRPACGPTYPTIPHM